MQFIAYNGKWYNPRQIVSVDPPKIGKIGTLFMSNGDQIPIDTIPFSELRQKFDLHISVQL